VKFSSKLALAASRPLAISAPPPFAPTDVAGIKLWLAADQGIWANGSNRVEAWSDYSGTGYIFTPQASPKQPLYVASGPGGKPSLRFDAVRNDYLEFANVTNSITAGAAHTTFTVFSPVNLTGLQFMWYMRDFTDDVGMSLVGTNPRYFFNSAYVSYGITLTASGLYVMSMRFDGTTATLKTNGSVTATDTPATPASYTGTKTVRIGAYAAASAAFDGHISEIIWYTGAKTAPEVTAVETYLLSKYGL
jgi:hypothetical protein